MDAKQDMRPLVLAPIVLFLAGGCSLSLVSSRPDLTDKYVPGKCEDLKRQVERSPVIVFGKVNAAMAIGPPRNSTHLGSDLKLQLMKVFLAQSVCLRGCTATEGLAFYYFSYAGSPRGYTGPPLIRMSQGESRVLFLEWEKGVLRTRCDMEDCSYAVAVGSKWASKPLGERQTIGEYLARLFLEVDDVMDEAEIKTRLRMGAATASALVGEQKAMLLLRSILKNGPDRSRMAACVTLAETFPGQDDCLGRAAANGDDRGAPVRMVEILAANRSRDLQIRRRLRYLVNEADGRNMSGQELRSACGELEVLLFHRDNGIRKEAEETNFALCR